MCSKVGLLCLDIKPIYCAILHGPSPRQGKIYYLSGIIPSTIPSKLEVYSEHLKGPSTVMFTIHICLDCEILAHVKSKTRQYLLLLYNTHGCIDNAVFTKLCKCQEQT